MAKDTLQQILHRKCSKLPNVDAVIISAIIEVESAWNPLAMKFEPGFMYIYKPTEYALKNRTDAATEKCMQRFSWGLGQVMGGTARSLGYDGTLAELLEPSLNLDYVLLYYEKCCSNYVYSTDKMAAYNFGSVKRMANGTYINQNYVDKVLKILDLDPTWKASQAAVPTSDRPN